MRYKDLPQEYKDLLRKRVKDEGENPDTFIKGYDPISFLFVWRETPEGYDFWKKVNQAEPHEELPPIPEEE